MSEINNIIKQAAEACQLLLYGVERNHEGLLIYIDHHDRDITIGDCELMMKQLTYSTNLDNLHVEVSSKGVYPPLFTFEHYKDAVGQWVKVRTLDKSYKGILASVQDDEIALQKGEHIFNIAYPSIKSARLIAEPTGE